MFKDRIYINMEKEIIRLSEEKLHRKLTADERNNISKPRSLMGLESIIDYIKGTSFKDGELERYLSAL